MIQIVADIGVNHSGNCHKAKRLVDAAISIGVDSIKFQAWQKETFPNLAELHMPYERLEKLFNECEKAKMNWFCTPFDLTTVKWLDDLDMSTWKLPSNDAVIKNSKLLHYIAEECIGDTVILSTATFDNLQDIWPLLALYRNHDLILLHCVSEYPTSPEKINPQRMLDLKKFGKPVGHSDHSGNIVIPLLMAQLGAEMIEAHLTLDKTARGPDHKASLDVWQFAELVRKIRGME